MWSDYLEQAIIQSWKDYCSPPWLRFCKKLSKTWFILDIIYKLENSLSADVNPLPLVQLCAPVSIKIANNYNFFPGLYLLVTKDHSRTRIYGPCGEKIKQHILSQNWKRNGQNNKWNAEKCKKPDKVYCKIMWKLKSWLLVCLLIIILEANNWVRRK